MTGTDKSIWIVEAAMTDADIDDMLRKLNQLCLYGGRPFYLTVSGFDQDARELWEIPEALVLFDRLYKAGAMSVLECNCGPEYVPLAIGAYQLWIIQHRLWTGKAGFPESLDLFDRFCEDLKISNDIIDRKFPRGGDQ